jgi:hypothetical protein
MFVEGKPLQPSLMFASKAGAYLRIVPESCSSQCQATRLTHKHKDCAEKSCQRQTLKPIRPICIL